MRSDAQKSAESKYRKEKVKQHTLKFYPADADIYEHLQRQENRNGYLKQLIRRDMEAAATHKKTL